MPKVSVIVPIYNVEKYLEKCLESLVNQTLNDIQIILVNYIKNDKMTEVAWGYLYKTSFWKENNFKYSKYMYYEDLGLTPLIILKAKKVD